jgi:hypothetical protein
VLNSGSVPPQDQVDAVWGPQLAGVAGRADECVGGEDGFVRLDARPAVQAPSPGDEDARRSLDRRTVIGADLHPFLVRRRGGHHQGRRELLGGRVFPLPQRLSVLGRRFVSADVHRGPSDPSGRGPVPQRAREGGGEREEQEQERDGDDPQQPPAEVLRLPPQARRQRRRDRRPARRQRRALDAAGVKDLEAVVAPQLTSGGAAMRSAEGGDVVSPAAVGAARAGTELVFGEDADAAAAWVGAFHLQRHGPPPLEQRRYGLSKGLFGSPVDVPSFTSLIRRRQLSRRSTRSLSFRWVQDVRDRSLPSGDRISVS